MKCRIKTTKCMRSTALILSIALIFTFIGVSGTLAEEPQAPDVWDGTVAAGFSGGSGTRDDPYKISTAAELAYLASEVNSAEDDFAGKHFLLTRDIDLGNREWEAIGNYTPQNIYNPINLPFRGYFNGGGHVISNLYASITQAPTPPRGSCFGLFGYTADGSIENLGVSGNLELYLVDINFAFVGGLIAYNLNSDVSGCFADVNITVATGQNSDPYDYAGGLIGVNGVSFSDVSFEGRKSNVTISDCYSSGDIITIASVRTGGFIGYNGTVDTQGSSTTVTNCYATGNITGPAHISGGFIGENHSYKDLSPSYSGAGDAIITNCYYGGSILEYQPPGSIFSAGAFAALNNSIFKNCYFNSSANEGFEAIGYPQQGMADDVTSLAHISMSGDAAITAMPGFDFDGRWAASPEGYYPQLRFFSKHENAAFRAASLNSVRVLTEGRTLDTSLIGSIGSSHPACAGIDMLYSLDENQNVIIQPSKEQFKYYCCSGNVGEEGYASSFQGKRNIFYNYSSADSRTPENIRARSTSLRIEPEWLGYLTHGVSLVTAQTKPADNRELIKYAGTQISKQAFDSLSLDDSEFFVTLSDLSEHLNGIEIGFNQPGGSVGILPGVSTIQLLIDAGLAVSELGDANSILLMCEIMDDGSQRVIPFSIGELGLTGGVSHTGKTNAYVFKSGIYAQVFVEKTNFADTYGLWMEEAVAQLAARGIALGVGDGLFSPDTSLTRAQFVTMLMRTLGIPMESHAQFSDHESIPDWANTYSALALELGIIEADENGNFCPGESIERQEVFMMLYRAMEVMGISAEPLSFVDEIPQFTDWDKVTPEYVEAIETLVNSGMVRGDNGRLRPQDGLTRAEGTQVLLNLFSRTLNFSTHMHRA